MQNIKKFTPSEQSILTTILYSDIFSFPLMNDELWKFLISEKRIPRNEFEKSLSSLKKFVVYKKGYYCLIGREEIIEERMKNVSEVKKKMNLAHTVAEKLFRIPSILFIGISGGLAVKNAHRDDDIDLVIITKKNTLFFSRLLVLILLESLGVRRSRNQKNTANKICINLLFDETALGWFGKYKDIYMAREIAQVVPLFERNTMHQKFLDANKWIELYLPNIEKNQSTKSAKLREDYKKNLKKKVFLSEILSDSFEFLTRFLQMSIMKRHSSIETISEHLLAFHPYNYRINVLRQLRLKMRQFGLLTKI